jgi:hypothetical protein
MGQAKNRKSEIAALKANGAAKINPFIVRGKIIDGQVVYDTTGLETAQVAFVEGCVKSINSGTMLSSGQATPSQETHLTFVGYFGPQDFIGNLMGPFEGGYTPDEVYADAKMTFYKNQASYPQLGFTYTREEIVELGTEMAGFMMDRLAEGGQWPWPNAKCVFEKHGDILVVVETVA